MKFILFLSFVLGASCIPLKDAPCTADIVFVVDTSDSICSSVHVNQTCVYWDNMITFLDLFIQNFTVSWSGTRMSMVHFSGLGDTGVAFNLNKYFSNWGVKDAIDPANFNYWHYGGETNTGGALKLVDEQVLVAANGDRSDHPNVVLMFTDGNWNVGPPPIDYADKLWARGDTVIYAIGIGGDVSAAKMLELTRHQSNIYQVKDYLSLNNQLRDELTGVVTQCHHSTDQCAANPCLNSGTCTNVGSSYTCECPAGFEGYNCGRVMPCYVDPCQHGGTCQPNSNGFSCSCTEEWDGQYCEALNPCYGNTCATGAPITGTAPNLGHCVTGAVDCSAVVADGNYNTIGECKQGYTECVTGRRFDMKCPAELFYNCHIDECVYKRDNPDCQ